MPHRTWLDKLALLALPLARQHVNVGAACMETLRNLVSWNPSSTGMVVTAGPGCAPAAPLSSINRVLQASSSRSSVL